MHCKINTNLLYLRQTTLKESNSDQIYFLVLDIDECTKGTHRCHVNAVCNNTRGSYNCTCKDGFYGDGRNCIGIKKTLICWFWLNTLYNTQGCFLTHKHNNNNKHMPKDNHQKETQNKSIRTYLGRCWDPWPPFCKPFLSKQPTAGGEKDMTIWWLPSLWHSVTLLTQFEKSWLHPDRNPTITNVFWSSSACSALVMARTLSRKNLHFFQREI